MSQRLTDRDDPPSAPTIPVIDADGFAGTDWFSTLDTTTRRVYLPGGITCLASDTVGFIRRLPHELVARFHSTLEEALAARVLVHVADATAPELYGQIEVVEKTLEELGALHQPRVLALNKIDRLDQEAREDLPIQFHGSVPISAVEGLGLDRLKEKIDRALQEASQDALVETT